MTGPITYDWAHDADDLRLVTVDEILSAYEDGRIGAGTAMDLLDLENTSELQETMEYNGRTMPWARPMRLDPTTVDALEEALGVVRVRDAAPTTP